MASCWIWKSRKSAWNMMIYVVKCTFSRHFFWTSWFILCSRNSLERWLKLRKRLFSLLGVCNNLGATVGFTHKWHNPNFPFFRTTFLPKDIFWKLPKIIIFLTPFLQFWDDIIYGWPLRELQVLTTWSFDFLLDLLFIQFDRCDIYRYNSKYSIGQI